MAKIIKEYGLVKCIDVVPASDEAEVEWSTWRRDYVGRKNGLLNLYESQQKYPGEKFLVFFGNKAPWELKTSYGELIEDGEQIIFLTRNTRYVFRKLEE